jgi:RHS repeat-associated protein
MWPGALPLVTAALFLGLPARGWAQETVTYYHTDGIGSVRMITGASGNVVARYDYLPFGERCEAACPPTDHADKRQFAGKERDTQTGFDYFGARYYAGQTGRFTTVDPFLDAQNALVDPQLWNRYAYVRNNSLRYVDPDGRAVETLWDLASLGLSAKAVWQNPTSGWNWLSLGADAVSVLGPGLPAIGTVIRGASRADHVIDTSKGAGRVALDSNAIIARLEGSSGDVQAVLKAIAGRDTSVSITAVKEFLRGGGDVNALRIFLKETKGSVGAAPSTALIKSLEALGLKPSDARVVGSAIREGIPVLTRDKRILKRVPDVAEEF